MTPPLIKFYYTVKSSYLRRYHPIIISIISSPSNQVICIFVTSIFICLQILLYNLLIQCIHHSHTYHDEYDIYRYNQHMQRYAQQRYTEPQYHYYINVTQSQFPLLFPNTFRGTSRFLNDTDEKLRWKMFLTSIFNVDEAAGSQYDICKNDWLIVLNGNAVTSFRTLDQVLYGRQLDSGWRIYPPVHTSSIQTDTHTANASKHYITHVYGITVRSEPQRFQRLYQHLHGVGIQHFYWQLGSDIVDIRESRTHLYDAQTLLNRYIDKDTPITGEISCAMKHLQTIRDYAAQSVGSNSLYLHSTYTNQIQWSSQHYTNPYEYSIRNSIAGNADKLKNALFGGSDSDPSNHEIMMVVEDDAVFAPYFRERLDWVLNNLPIQFSIISIGGCCDEHSLPDGNNPIYTGSEAGGGVFQFSTSEQPRLVERDYIRCTTAYLISRRYANDMVHYIKQHASHADYGDIQPSDYSVNYAVKQLWRSYSVPAFLLEPPIVYQSSKAVYDDQGKITSLLDGKRITDIKEENK